MHILHVVGARPNFMKAAPVMRALTSFDGFRQTLVHTGQHYDTNMSEVFFQQLDIPEPDINLEVGSGSHTSQTAKIMSSFESVALKSKPDLVLVYGDVNSTVATALVCAKMSIPVGHVEAGLRSFDRTMPEEINRLLTDQIADLLFTPSRDADENLLREGISSEKIHLVGNVMIDTLVHLLPKALDRWSILRSSWSLEQFGLVTLHRPSNVDHPEKISSIINTLVDIGELLPLVFPIHPRTRQRLEDLKLFKKNSGV
jgi:UDP-N-acetylglucosamine 2-epimerase (non-hydrolysing)